MATITDQIRAKLTRAKQHIGDFRRALKAFYETNPYGVAVKEDTEAGARIYYLSRVSEVPLEITTIAADVLQNLRSSLDHVATQLVLQARSGAPPDWLVYYPITSVPSEYPALRARNIRSVSQDVVDAIDATEPYKGGKGHALWQVNELNKVDKHHLLVAAGSFFRNVDVSGDFKRLLKQMGWDDAASVVPPILLRPANPLLSLKVGDELFVEPLTDPSAPLVIRPDAALIVPKDAVRYDRKFTFDVSFNKPAIIACEPAVKTLEGMSNSVSGVVESLAPFIKGNGWLRQSSP